MLVFLYVYVWFRATLPRLRYDQLMDLGWKLLIPVSLGWFLLLAALQVGRDPDNDWDPWLVAVVVRVAVLLAGYVLLTLALAVSRRNREREGAMY